MGSSQPVTRFMTCPWLKLMPRNGDASHRTRTALYQPRNAFHISSVPRRAAPSPKTRMVASLTAAAVGQSGPWARRRLPLSEWIGAGRGCYRARLGVMEIHCVENRLMAVSENARSACPSKPEALPAPSPQGGRQSLRWPSPDVYIVRYRSIFSLQFRCVNPSIFATPCGPAGALLLFTSGISSVCVSDALTVTLTTAQVPTSRWSVPPS